MTSLREAQALFWRGLHGDPTVPDGFLRSDGRQDAAARLRVYAESVQARLLEALALTYPMTADLVGQERFGALCKAYLRVHPPRHFSLQQAGESLPEFLGAAPVRADAAELCRLERMHTEAFEAAEAPCANFSELASRGANAPAARLALAPALRHARFAHAVLALGRGERPAAPQNVPCYVAVWRSGLRDLHSVQAVHTALDAPAAGALILAAAGAPLGEICQSFAGCPDPQSSAFAALSAWFADGWVAAVL